MLRKLLRICLALVVMVAAGGAVAADDERSPVALPAEVAAAFMAEMRTHMANLDDIVTALAEEDFKQASAIAGNTMTAGHHMWQMMAEGGASEAAIARAKARHKEMRAKRGPGAGMGMGMGGGFGRYMPEGFRAMGMAFHEAAETFAAAAAAVTSPPSVDDYRNVLEGLQEVTTACRACHEAYRIEPEP